MEIVRVAGIRTGLRFCGAILRFATIGYIAASAGAVVLGIFGLYRTVVIFASILSDFGVSQALIKYLSEETETSEYFTAYLFITFILTLVTLGIIYSLRSPIAEYISKEVTVLLLIGVLGQTSVGVINSTLIGEQRVAILSTIEFIHKLVASTVQIVAIAIFGFGAVGLIVGEIIGFSAIVILGVFLIRTRIAIPERKHIVDLLDFTRHTWVIPISQRIRSKLDTFVLGLFFGPALVGVYELVWMLSSVFSYLPLSVRTVIFPEVSKREASGTDTTPIAGQAVIYSAIFIMPGVVGAAIVGTDLLGVFGSEYQVGYVALVLLIAGRVSMAVFDILDGFFLGIGRSDISFWGTVTVILSNIAGNFLLTPRYGLAGAAVATLLAFTLGAALQISKKSSLLSEAPFRPLITSCASAAVMGGVLLLFELLIDFSQSTFLVVSEVLVGGSIFLLLIYLGDAEIRERANQLLRR